MNAYESYFLDRIASDPAAAAKTMERVVSYIEQSSAGRGEGCHSVHPLPIPKIYARETIAIFRDIVDTTYRIFSKIIRAYHTDSELRRAFGFSPELESYILRDCGYDCPLPIARFDIFYHEDTGNFKFCEINTDGTSAMNENRELNHSLEHNAIYQDYLRHLQQTQKMTCGSFELFDRWVSCFADIYAAYSNSDAKPYVAIVDFLDKAYMADFVAFEQCFRRRGYEVEICDIRKLTYQSGRLLSPSGHGVDAVYRRAVTSDIFRNTADVADFLAACRDNAVCLIGAFQTQIVHNKQLFIVLHHAALDHILSEEERSFIRSHVPYTQTLSAPNANADGVIAGKDRWILKPLDSYAAQGIYLGYDYSQSEWESIVKSCYDKGYLYQEFFEPYRTPNVDLAAGTTDVQWFHNLTGLYVYGGQMAGVYSRACVNRLIAGQFGGKELPTVYTLPQ